MTSLVHGVETAFLLLAAYVMGCVVGYGIRRILHAARGTRRVTLPVAEIAVADTTPVPAPTRRRSPAARLAAASGDPLPAAVTRTRRKSTGPKPATLDRPRNGQADDLKQIKGIGPKIEATLNGLGIYHIDQIAGWTAANAAWIDGKLAFKGRVGRERWVEQAAELARAKVA